MAIQLPDPGTGVPADKTGDSPWLATKKVRENFNDQSNAASRLVGTAAGTVPENVTAFGVANCGYAGRVKFLGDINLDVVPNSTGKGIGVTGTTGLPCGFFYSDGAGANNYKFGQRFFINVNFGANQGWRLGSPTTGKDLYFQWADRVEWSEVVKLYHTGNTTKEPTTGYLKAASPILHLFNGDLVKEHEAALQDITVEKLGVGNYLIKGSTGLSSEGWSLSPPKDIHGNVLCMVEATEADGNINVKTYKRKFDFDIVAIVPDYEQPLDIPEGHSVDLRLNDLPQEPEPEV